VDSLDNPSGLPTLSTGPTSTSTTTFSQPPTISLPQIWLCMSSVW